MKLYEIEHSIMECLQDVDEETGEILNIEKLEQLEMERDKKLEGIALAIKNYQAEADAVKNEKMNLAKRQQVLENKVDSMKRWLTEILGGEKFSTARCAISFRSSESVNISEDGEKILYEKHPELFVIQPPKINKTETKKAMKLGLESEGLELVYKVSCNIK